MMEVEIRCFGAFRKYERAGGAPLRVRVAEGATVGEVKRALAATLADAVPGFSDGALVEDSALADDRRILAVSDRVDAPCTLMILPPVCGG